jgi:flagellar protein FliL
MAEKKQTIVDGEEKKSPKMLIIIIAVILLLGGGGAAYYFLMMSDSPEGENTEQIDAKESEDEEESEDSVARDVIYYDISKPLVVDFPRGSSAHLIQISVSIMVDKQETSDALQKHDPMIRNNLLMLISKEGSESLSTQEGKEKLRASMLAEIEAVLKKMSINRRVKEVFFTAFVMQ